MKLLFCPNCQDVIKLVKAERRYCLCKKSSGQYREDGLNAEIYGDAIPLGIDNTSLQRALFNRKPTGRGVKLNSFVIAKKCSTVIDHGQGAALKFNDPDEKEKRFLKLLEELGK